MPTRHGPDTDETSAPAMTTPWLPDTFAHPQHVPLSAEAHLRPISPDDLDIDMPAVMGNQAMLWAKYGEAWGWPPATMTADQDREDLARHAAEMETHESFNYAILPTDESVLWGCVYIDPADADVAEVGADTPRGPVAEVSWWVVPDAAPGLAEAVSAFVPAWLEREWPFVAVRYPFGERG